MTKRRFAVFDIDGTLFRGGLYRELAHEVMRRGAIQPHLVAAAEAKLTQWHCRGARDAYDQYEQSLVKALDQSLPTIPVAIYDAAVAEVVTQQLDQVYTYTRHRLQELQAAGYFLIAISGSQEEVVRPFARHYGFDAWVGQRYVRRGDHFTGEIIKTHTDKDILLRQLVAKFDLTWKESYAFGDSAGDRHMLKIVTHPVAFNPTEELLTEAMAQHWPVVIERKSVVYMMKQGDHGYFLANAGKI